MVRETFSVFLGCALAVCTVSCGRIGYDPLDLAPDARGGTDASVTPPHLDASTDGGGLGLDGSAGPDGAIDSTMDTGSDGGGDSTLDTGDTSDESPDGGADAGGDAVADAPSEASYPYPSCAATRVWSLAFDSDPTQLFWSDDGGPEWVLRAGGAFPVAELEGGVWTSAGGPVLDTRPLDPFPSRVLVDVRMRSLAVSAGQHGAVFWINMNEGAPQFSALFAALGLDPDGGQTLSVWGKPAGVETTLAAFPGLAEAMVDIHLDADPIAGTVGVWVDGDSKGTYALPLTGAPNGDEFATILSWGGTSAFESVEIQDCAP
jgi:hypothetical protein